MHVVFAVLNGLLKRKSKRIELKLINSSGKPTSTNNAVLVLGKLGPGKFVGANWAWNFFVGKLGLNKLGPLAENWAPAPGKLGT